MSANSTIPTSAFHHRRFVSSIPPYRPPLAQLPSFSLGWMICLFAKWRCSQLCFRVISLELPFLLSLVLPELVQIQSEILES